jgi:ketosteroid isomerase-like protein
VYTVPQVIHGTRESMCANLTKLFSNASLQLHYDNPDIHEIIMSGGVAIVRLTWTLTTQTGAGKDVTTEEGMDIFRRQPDGRWSIARFIAFGTQPNKN